MQAAKSKLDKALKRLEKVIKKKAATPTGSQGMDLELVAAKAEITELKEKNQAASTRLEGAIGRMNDILES